MTGKNSFRSPSESSKSFEKSNLLKNFGEVVADFVVNFVDINDMEEFENGNDEKDELETMA